MESICFHNTSKLYLLGFTSSKINHKHLVLKEINHEKQHVLRNIVNSIIEDKTTHFWTIKTLRIIITIPFTYSNLVNCNTPMITYKNSKKGGIDYFTESCGQTDSMIHTFTVFSFTPNSDIKTTYKTSVSAYFHCIALLPL